MDMTDEELKNASEEYCPDDAYPFGPDIINKEVRKAFIAGWKAKEESEKPMNQDEELNNEIKALVNEYGYEKSEDILLIAIVARHFAQWQYQKDRGKFAQIKAKTWSEGFDTCKEQMLKKAVDGYVTLTMTGIPTVAATIKEGDNIRVGNKVRIIVIPNTDEK